MSGVLNIARLVEVLRRYSRSTYHLILPDLADLGPSKSGRTSHSSTSPYVPIRGRQRLDPASIQQLATDYLDGTPTTQLIIKYHLGKGTVLRLLASEGVQMRRQSLTPEQILEGAQLYGSGLSLAQVGQQLGCDHCTVWRALRVAGIPMRDTHGEVR